ncbi:hypothetical protein PYW07_007442 [Mythimna separata]|uniref:Nudix hydrolase domain-containing protein n=1 Tax=Mythimna separata TaxID=271217 RepID=A0AAD8E008_MYTSE|nr:hypothetical protein PYW07_007442 [Mythimna separata]
MWRYKSADWDEMRHFFASYPWQQVCFSSEDPSSCVDAISDVVRQAMEYYIPYSDVPVGGSAHPWFNADCAEAEKRKHSAFLAWADARDRKAPDLSSKKRAFNHAAKSYKKALRRARFDRITHIGKKLSAQPSGSRAFWSLAKSVEANFCRPTLPPLVKPDGTLAHTAREKAGLFASLFAHNSRLDTSSATPPSLPHCDSSMSEVRIRNKEVLRALCRLDVNKASGPDGVPAIVLKACAPELVPRNVERTRTRSATFANSVVFPGGVSESVDGSPRWLELLKSFGYTKQDLEAFHRPDSVINPIFQNNPIQRHLQLRITAIRETFEELGLLICSRQKKEQRTGLWADIVHDIDVKNWQSRVAKDPGDWITLCEEHQCYPDIWSLHLWSNWLTPLTIPKRFDTAFFVTALENKPKSIGSSSEVVSVEWLSPAEVLQSDKKLQPPQLYELNRLACVKDIQELVKFAREKSGHGTDLIYPVFVKAKDGEFSVLPGDDLYPSSVDYNNDNIINCKNQTILELREASKTIHRVEIVKGKYQLVIKNYKPKHHINMEDMTFPI